MRALVSLWSVPSRSKSPQYLLFAGVLRYSVVSASRPICAVFHRQKITSETRSCCSAVAPVVVLNPHRELIKLSEAKCCTYSCTVGLHRSHEHPILKEIYTNPSRWHYNSQSFSRSLSFKHLQTPTSAYWLINVEESFSSFWCQSNAGLRFGVNTMKAWMLSALCQQPRLQLMQWSLLWFSEPLGTDRAPFKRTHAHSFHLWTQGQSRKAQIIANWFLERNSVAH